MLDRSREASAPPWARAAAPFVGAAIALAVAIYGTWTGIDHAVNPCELCHDPLLPRDWWKWILVTAVGYYLIGAFLAYKAVRALIKLRRPPPEN